MKTKNQQRMNTTIERLKLPVYITDIKSYSKLHDFVIVDDFDKVTDLLISIHPSAFMNINGVIYYEVACAVLNFPRKLYNPPELAKKLLGRDNSRKVTNQTRVFIPWKCSLPLSTHASDNLHVLIIKYKHEIYNFEIYDFMEYVGNKLDIYEYMEDMLARYNLSIPEFSDCLVKCSNRKNRKPIETYELEFNDK